MVSAILGKKLNMSQRFDTDGRQIPVTLIAAGPCLVKAKKTYEKQGFVVAVVEYQKSRNSTISKELRVTNGEEIEIGGKITVDNFVTGDLVKITGISKGKGFAGVVKRWGFAGGPKTHGQSDRHRAPGSIGAGTTPGRVLKGKKMAGRLGGKKLTLSNVEVIEVDKDNNLLAVKGPVPGHFKSIVFIQKTGQKQTKEVQKDQVEKEQDSDVQKPAKNAPPEPAKLEPILQES